MALIKQPIPINFSQGLDLKTDEFQVQLGKFLELKNMVFDVGGRLTKRNGYGPLVSTVLGGTSSSVSSSPSTLSASYLTTFNGDLTAIGTTLSAYSAPNNGWVNKGTIQPITLTTLPLIRSNTNQSQIDTAVAANGLVCTVYTDNPASGVVYKYAVADSATGQNIIAPTTLTSCTGSPRVFVLGSYFIIAYTATNNLNYIAVSTSNPNKVTSPVTITVYTPKTTVSWDGAVYNNRLYITYNNTTGGQSVNIRTLSSTLTVSTAKTFAAEIATIMSMTIDITMPSQPIIWAAYYDLAGTAGKAFAVDQNLNTVLTPTAIISTGTYLNITCTAQNNILTFLLEAANNYGYDSGTATHLITTNTLTQAGVLGSTPGTLRSVGLASKAFLYNGIQYVLGVYSSAYQPTYFLLNGSGNVISQIAYSNGGGYDTVGLPSVTLTGSVAQIGYLIKDLISAAAKPTPATPTVQTSPVYSQTGLNLVSFNLAVDDVNSTELGSNLNLTGGFISGYDGYSVTEQNFFLWPDNVKTTTSSSGGSIEDQTNYYIATYEWADNAGNVFRSAPSIPFAQITSGGNTSTNTINVPTLRLTYKIANPVKIVVYRWSTLQQVYYAITSPAAAPTFNNTAVDYVTITDTFANASILGNPILYTTGGVLENIGPPSSNIMTLFNNRLWLVDAEDRNLLWFSKQVIEATPVEMSDLLTMYIAPTTGSQGSTGPMTALAPMDDKLVIFKRDALGYISGIGPDNTGSNSSYTDFILINSVVGCTNQKSIVLTPAGLMFQSDKGIWIVGRDLNTSYIGAPVETLTQGATVQSALNIPTTNQVRFTLDTGVTLMYDYFFGQWGEFVNVPAVSSTIFEQLHTYINEDGLVFQETPGQYLDNSSPVLMSFVTGWANLAGLQGFQRFYFLYLLGTYITPFKLDVQLAYNYNSSPVQATLVTPNPNSIVGDWGDDQLWGSSSAWGGAGNVFQARLFPQIQKCESFQVSVNEVYDASYGIQPGAGLTLSGMNVIIGSKKGYKPKSASRSFG